MKTRPSIQSFWLILTVFTLPSCEFAQADETSPTKEELNTEAAEAMKILRRCCSRCHKGESSFFNAASIKSLTDSYIVPEDVESSYILDVMKSGIMPPRNRPQLPRPTPEEFETLSRWVEYGCEEPDVELRKQVTLETELQNAYRYLTQAKASEQANIRFFTLRQLHNDPTVDEFQLTLTRAALSKTLNSLSWERELVIPRAIDANGNEIPARVGGEPNPEFSQAVLFAVDIEKLGWTREHWNTILAAYPYAVSYEGRTENEALHELSQKIENVRGARDPAIVRADWFVSVATRPPVYHALLYELQIPELRHRTADPTSAATPLHMTDIDLEQYLGLEVNEGIITGRAKRSGFTESGVSGQNRLIERHNMPRGGAYWKSYDFKESNRRSILTEFPLGPAFKGNPYNALAFEHDGGEIIFNLPNGMQAYLLIDGEGGRIDAGPIDVVGDSLKTSGNEQIFVGVSCMACHRDGMIPSPRDEVRKFSALAGSQRDLLQELYPEPETLNDLILEDSEFFQRSLNRTLKNFVSTDELDGLPEPVGEVSRRYFLEPMQIETVAAELDVTVEDLKAGLKVNRTLQQMGLRVLTREGGAIKRAAWETGEGNNRTALTMMKEVAREFGYSPRQ